MASSDGVVYRINLDTYGPRRRWGEPFGVPEGSDFRLEAILRSAGALDTVNFTSSGTVTLSVSDSVLNGGVALLTDVAASSFNPATGLVKFAVTQSTSDGWEAGDYNGDIKHNTSSTGTSQNMYFQTGLKIRAATD